MKTGKKGIIISIDEKTFKEASIMKINMHPIIKTWNEFFNFLIWERRKYGHGRKQK